MTEVAKVVERRKLAKIKDTVKFYDYQVDGVRHLCRQTSHILGDEMGLGKSLQALATAAVAFEDGEMTRLLIVAPASLRANWAEEIERHTNFTYQLLDGTPLQRQKRLRQFVEYGHDILIVGYEQVVSHLSDLNALKFGMVIYDEAQYIKGYKTARTQACLALTAPRHILLTGSPLLRQVDDLWALLNRVDPKAFDNYFRFVHRYAVYGGYKGKQLIAVKNEAELREKLHKRMLRREADQYLKLPPYRVLPEKVNMSAFQRGLYEQMREELRVEAPGLDEGELVSQNAMVRMLRLKQITGTCAAVPGQPDDSPKLDRVVEMIVELIESGEPVVVFTQFRVVLECLAQRLSALEIDSFQLHGDIPKDRRAPIVRQWSDMAALGVARPILCMYQVAATGLNMTAASKMIRVDRVYAPEINKQALKRIHRIGQTKPCTIWDMFVRNSIDTRIEAILRDKSTTFDKLVALSPDWKRRAVASVLADGPDVDLDPDDEDVTAGTDEDDITDEMLADALAMAGLS